MLHFQLNTEKPTLWAGTTESWQELVTTYEASTPKLAELLAKSDSDGPELPPIWERAGDVAVVNIHGSLVSGSSGWYRMFGILGYDDIQEALIEAVGDKQVKSILLNVRSGGGHVEGVSDLSHFISDVDGVKPVTTFASGTMASAAYWLGANGRHILAAETSVLGSLGVLIVHAERSKQYADAGLKVTVIRSGKYKALVNAYEPLTDAAKEELQTQVDYIDDLFMTHVGKSLGIDKKTVTSRMGQGREFIGRMAVDVGLAEEITNMTGALAVASAVGELQSAAKVAGKK